MGCHRFQCNRATWRQTIGYATAQSRRSKRTLRSSVGCPKAHGSQLVSNKLLFKEKIDRNI